MIGEITLETSTFFDEFCHDFRIRQHSPQTLSFRRLLLDKLLWFLQQKRFESCGKPEVRAFLAYVTSGHAADGGRWGNPHLTQQARPSTTKTYHSHLRTFSRWLIAEGVLTPPRWTAWPRQSPAPIRYSLLPKSR